MAQVFSCQFCEISKNAFYYRTSTVAASIFVGKKHDKNDIQVVSISQYQPITMFNPKTLIK